MAETIQQIKEMIAAAKKAALDKVQEGIRDLNDLGFQYFFGEGVSQPKKAGAPRKMARKKKGRGGSRQVKAGPCPICKFETAPPHDGRKHRGQKKKGPFGPGELKEMGLTKVK